MFGKGKHETAGLTRKRLMLAAGSAATVAAVATLAAGITFGLFSATTASQTNQFSAGTVTLTSNTSGACSVGAILPGTSDGPCTLTASYSGIAAYMGLDVLIATKAGNGGINLYNPADSTGDLQITVMDNQGTPVTYVSPTTSFGSATCPSPYYGNGYTCYQLTDLLVSKAAFTSSSSAVTFTTSVTLPSFSATGYQGGKAQIILTAHAVQAANNGSTSSCTAGHECDTFSPGTGAPRWS